MIALNLRHDDDGYDYAKVDDADHVEELFASGYIPKTKLREVYEEYVMKSRQTLVIFETVKAGKASLGHCFIEDCLPARSRVLAVTDCQGFNVYGGLHFSKESIIKYAESVSILESFDTWSKKVGAFANG